MKNMRLISVLLCTAAFFATGCIDKKKINDIEETQTEILAKVNAIEANQKELLKLFRPRRPAVDYNKVHNIPVGHSKIRGNKNALVTVVEFSDFQCQYCARLLPTLKQVLNAFPNDVRLVYKDFPLSFHKQAMNASRAAHAAGEQGKYWEMHDLIFDNYNKLDENKFGEFAIKLKLDSVKFMADFKSNKYDKQIQDDMNLGRKVGVTGTPTLFMNGKRMRGRSFNDFKSAIDEYIKKGKG